MLRPTRLALIALCAFALRCATAHYGRYEQIEVLADTTAANAQVVCDGGWQQSAATPAKLVIPRKAESCVVTVSDELTRASVGLDLVDADFEYVADRVRDSWKNGLDGCLGDGEAAGACILLGSVGYGLAYVYGFVSDRFDDATGAVYRHEPNRIQANLHPEKGPPKVSVLGVQSQKR